MKLRMLTVVFLVATGSSPGYSQNSAQPILEAGLTQLEAARQTRTDAAYASAEEAFTGVLAAEPSNARALVYRGEARIMRGVLLVGTALPTALEYFQAGMADMDRAVSIAPNDVIVRIIRGIKIRKTPQLLRRWNMRTSSRPTFQFGETRFILKRT
jgi:hypothetical protein